MDGKSILDYFGGRVAAEIRLPEAIDRKLLCPFQYFGIADTVDLTDLRWVRGGYDKSQLSNLYSLNRSVAERRADHIIRSIDSTKLVETTRLSYEVKSFCCLIVCDNTVHGLKATKCVI